MENEKLLFSKLRQPVHISYIAKYILKENEKDTKEILEKYIGEGKIQESKLSKGYFQAVSGI
jgi:hypothetical protein